MNKHELIMQLGSRNWNLITKQIDMEDVWFTDDVDPKQRSENEE